MCIIHLFSIVYARNSLVGKTGTVPLYASVWIGKFTMFSPFSLINTKTLINLLCNKKLSRKPFGYKWNLVSTLKKTERSNQIFLIENFAFSLDCEERPTIVRNVRICLNIYVFAIITKLFSGFH